MSSPSQERAMVAAVGDMLQNTNTVVRAVPSHLLFAIPNRIPRLKAGCQELCRRQGHANRAAFISTLTPGVIQQLTIRFGRLDHAFEIVMYELTTRLKTSGTVDLTLWDIVVLIARRFCDLLHHNRGGSLGCADPVQGMPAIAYSQLAESYHEQRIACEESRSWQRFLDLLVSASPTDQCRIVKTLVP